MAASAPLRALVAPLAYFVVIACADDTTPDAASDAATDAGVVDVGRSDSGPNDARPQDATSLDAAAGQDAVVPDVSVTLDASGGAAFRGPVRFVERFEDTDFGGRGWYDAPQGELTTIDPAEGSSAFVCRFLSGARGCEGGSPSRHEFTESESVYLSYWVKYSANWVGSQRPYHPHELHFVTNADDRWVGPAFTHLTTYIEQVGGVARLAMQDGRNVDTDCILRNDDAFVGCNGDFNSYVFAEQRSVCSCNGLMGDLDERDCYSRGDGTWYSARGWAASNQTFRDDQGPNYKGDWHFVEAYFEMNDITGSVGVPNGRIRYWMDGELLISSDRILMRTNEHPNLAFNQFLIAPYIGDGSPIEQTMWLDEITVAAGQ